jgi:DNA-binding NarL/FixJ family response regulator
MADYGYPAVERERLRRLAIEADSGSRATADLAEMWQALVEGRLAILDHLSTQERHFLIFEPVVDGMDERKLNSRQLNFLQRLLLGQPQKGVAIDCRTSASTVAGTLAETLRVFGLNVSASRAPALLSLMLHAHRGQAPIHSGRVSAAVDGERTLCILSIRRLDEVIGSMLSPAEQAVVRLRTDGRSHAEIASIRHTSRRTIANQLASASRKLGVSGRCELLSYLSRVTTALRPEQQQLGARPASGETRVLTAAGPS